MFCSSGKTPQLYFKKQSERVREAVSPEQSLEGSFFKSQCRLPRLYLWQSNSDYLQLATWRTDYTEMYKPKKVLRSLLLFLFKMGKMATKEKEEDI